MMEHRPERVTCPACHSNAAEEGVTDGTWLCGDCGLLFDPKQKDSDEHEDPVVESDASCTNLNRKREAWADHAKVTSGTEQRLVSAISRIEEVSNRLELPVNVRKRAAELYTMASTERLTVGRSSASLVPTTLLIASHENNWAIPLTVIADAGDVEPRKVAKYRRLFVAEMDLDLGRVPPVDYLPYLVTRLDCDDTVLDIAARVLDEVTEDAFSDGVNPAGIAAAALYLAAQGQVTQREVALRAGLTTETIRVRLADLREGRQ